MRKWTPFLWKDGTDDTLSITCQTTRKWKYTCTEVSALATHLQTYWLQDPLIDLPSACMVLHHHICESWSLHISLHVLCSLLHSQDSIALHFWLWGQQPTKKRKKSGARSFKLSAPKLGDNLPDSIRKVESIINYVCDCCNSRSPKCGHCQYMAADHNLRGDATATTPDPNAGMVTVWAQGRWPATLERRCSSRVCDWCLPLWVASSRVDSRWTFSRVHVSARTHKHRLLSWA